MIKDLSHHQKPISDLFKTAKDWSELCLSADQIDFFRKNGFLGGIRVLDEKQIEQLRDELSELIDPAHPGHSLFHEFHSNESVDRDKVLFHALGAWRITSGFHDLLWHPAVLVPTSQLLGGAVRFWHDQLFCKPAYHGGVVAWHQDYSYWTRTQPLAHLTCWIGLDDANTENGCLQYIPGSHFWDLLPITGLAGDMESILSVLTDDQKTAFHPVPMELKAGECCFHHGLTVHGSYENTSPRPRRGVVINFARDGVKSVTSDALLEGVPPLREGEPLSGQFFPLLHEGPPNSEEKI